MQALILLVIVGVALAVPPPAQLHVEPKEDRPADFICKDGAMVPNAHVIEGITKCKQEYAPGSGKNADCSFFCEAKVLNLLDRKTGLPTEAVYTKWAAKNLLSSQTRVARAHFGDCLSKYLSQVSKTDETCAGAKLFGDCTWALQPKLVC